MRRNRSYPVLSVAFLVGLAIACNTATAPQDVYPIPRETSDGWQTASLESVGMDPGPLQRLGDLIENTDNHRIHSVLIAKDQKLVFEEYWPGTDLEVASLTPVEKDFDIETLHYVASVSKSITSMLAGIAVDRGLISSVEDSLFTFFPEYVHLKRSDNGAISLKHLLSFSSGFDWNEFVYGFGDSRDSHYRMFNSADPVAYLLGRPVTSPPGNVFHYNSGDTNLLGEVVRRRSNSANLTEFADRHLFQPLGIVSFDWHRFPGADHLTFASGGASLRPRDMAKLGAVYLNGGLWNGERVISASWVAASTAMHVPLMGSYRTLYGYGYNWWLGRSRFGSTTVDYFRAAGWGGQYIYVYPELQMVLVFTAGGYYESGPLDVNDLIEDYILAALVDGSR